MKKVDSRFSYDGLDLPVMQRSVDSVIKAIEDQVKSALATGQLDAALLHSALCTLAHASARAQEEYQAVKDESLPPVWTSVAFAT